MRLDAAELKDTQLVLGRRETHRLGPHLNVTGCSVDIDCAPNELLMRGVTFVGCRIHVSTRLKNFIWVDNAFIHCSFSGHLVGSRFGHIERFPYDPTGQIEACDFSAAVLDFSDFANTSPNQMKLPRWPGFSIVQPRIAVEALSNVPLPGRLTELREVLRAAPEITVVSLDALSVKSFYGVGDGELNEFLQKIPLEHLLITYPSDKSQ